MKAQIILAAIISILVGLFLGDMIGDWKRDIESRLEMLEDRGQE